MVLINTDLPVQTFLEAFRPITKPGLVIRGLRKDHNIAFRGSSINGLRFVVNHIDSSSIVVRFQNVPNNVSIFDTENKLTVQQGQILRKQGSRSIAGFKRGSILVPESPRKNDTSETTNISIVLGDGRGTEIKVFLDAANAFDGLCSVGVIGKVNFKQRTEKAVTLEVV